MRTWIRWLLLATAYVVSFSWYTSFGGPLSQDEIEHYVAQLEAQGRPASAVATWRRFMQSDSGDDFAMANFIEWRDQPLPVSAIPPDESTAAVFERYSGPFARAALPRASHPVAIGSAAAAAMDFWGASDVARTWSQAALVRDRSRRDLIEIVLDPARAGSHDYKVAAIQKTIAFPIDPWFQLGDPRVVLALLLVAVGLILDRVVDGGAANPS